MKKIYNTPEIEMIVLHTQDIITQSDGDHYYDEQEQEHVYDVSGWF